MTATSSPLPAVALPRPGASTFAWLLAAFALIALVGLPLGWLVVTSLSKADGGGLTLHNYAEAFGSRIYLGPILNSFALASGVAVFAVVIAVPLAWLVARTDIAARTPLRLLLLAAFVTPSFIAAEAWILLAAPNSGWLNRGWTGAFGVAHGPLNVYSLAGAMWVMGLANVPYTFTLVVAALESLPSEMEDAASMLGAGVARVARSITLPLVLPAIVAGFILSFLEALAEFGTPAFLLIPARTQVITTQLYLFFQFPVRVEVAAAYALPLLLVTMALLGVQRRLLGRRSYTLVGTKGGRSRRIALGVWRRPLTAAAFVPPLLGSALPYATLLATSLSKVWSHGLVPANLTLYWYRWALIDNATTKGAIVNSFVYAVCAATIAAFLSVFIAYIVVRKLTPAAGILGFLAMAPLVIPGIVLAIGLYAAYTHPPLVLYGTGAILIVAFTTRFLPIAYANVATAVRAIHPDLERAARALGATPLQSLRMVTVPLARPALFSAWLLVLIPALRELSTAIFLFTPKTATMTTVIYDFTDEGNYEAVATMAVILLTLTLAIVALGYRFVGGTMMRGRST